MMRTLSKLAAAAVAGAMALALRACGGDSPASSTGGEAR
jgi:hypothetical protein